MAGPGFGAWRELAANQSVTEGILAGETESFTLLHHWRVLPGRQPVAAEHLDIDRPCDRDREPRAVFRASPQRVTSLAERSDRQSRHG